MSNNQLQVVEPQVVLDQSQPGGQAGQLFINNVNQLCSSTPTTLVIGNTVLTDTANDFGNVLIILIAPRASS